MLVNKVKDGILGFIVGDCLGVPNDFKDREYLKKNMTLDMIGFGSHSLPAGSYSDATSLTLATINSINNKKELNFLDIMNNYKDVVSLGKFTPHNCLFTIGLSTYRGINLFMSGNTNIFKCGATKITDNGSGSLKRMLPLAYYCYYKQLEDSEVLKYVKHLSYLTHRHEVSVIANYIYVKFIMYLLSGKTKEKSYNFIRKLDYSIFKESNVKLFDNIIKKDITKLKLSNIKTSSYTVDVLEASLWCFLKSKDYESSVFAAINVGDATIALGAITGSFSGIYYTASSINPSWINKVIKIDDILDIINKFEFTLKEKNLEKQLKLKI